MPYCDFNSHVHHGPFDEAAYLERYIKEIEHQAQLVPDQVVSSIFFGGGTPSLMDPRSVEKNHFRDQSKLAADQSGGNHP